MTNLLKVLTCWCISDKKGGTRDKGSPVIFVFGTRASGKTTVAQKLAETIGFTYLNLSRMVENEVKKGSFKGKLIEDLRKAKSDIPADVLVGMLSDQMPETAKGFVIAAFPNSVSQARRFEFQLRRPVVVIFCCIPEDLYISRLTKKDGAVDVAKEKKNFAKEHKAALSVYKHYEKIAIKLITNTPISENNDRLLAGFKKLGMEELMK